MMDYFDQIYYKHLIRDRKFLKLQQLKQKLKKRKKKIRLEEKREKRIMTVKPSTAKHNPMLSTRKIILPKLVEL